MKTNNNNKKAMFFIVISLSLITTALTSITYLSSGQISQKETEDIS